MAANVPASALTTSGDEKWKCLRQVPGAFHDIHHRWGDSRERAAVCNCVNLAGAATCACCEKERDPELSATVNT